MAFLTFASVVYLFFLCTFVYMIGFIAGLPFLPKTIDSGIAGARMTAIGIDVALLALFAIQHSVMRARASSAGGRASCPRRSSVPPTSSPRRWSCC